MKSKTSLKRMLSLGLCMALTLTLLSGAAFAVETFTTTDEGVELIKEFEDFRSMPYMGTDGEWYIGYGLACDPADYPRGITEEEAERLLREHLVQDEAWVNAFLLQYGVSINQQQFDALIDLTYTLGTQWIDPEYRLCAYLINGVGYYTEEEVVNAIATWCHSGGSLVLDNLVTRRLRDAYLFLYGEYENDGPERYCYIDFEPNGGHKDPNAYSRTIFYPIGNIYGDLPVPVWEGRVFQGWYTAEGVPLTGMEQALGSLHVYAHWEGGSVVPSAPVEEEKPDYSQWVNPYSDVKDNDWYFTYVRELNYYDIVSGYPDGTFRPNNQLTAGEALKLLLVAATKIDPGPSNVGHWAGNYLALAESLGCVPQGSIMDLDLPIDRLSIAQIASIALKLEAVEGVSPFADVDSGYTLALYEAGIVIGDTSGSERFFNPGSGITRAEMCTIVSRIRAYVPANNPMTSGYIEYYGKRYPVQWNVPAAPYNTDLFVKDGSIMYYNDSAYDTRIGIDVARFQGNIDWQKVAASGIEFAMLRVGGRGADSGEIYDDAQFLNYIQGAKAAGVKVGVYFYSTAVSVEEAVEEANYVLDKVRPYGLEYPIAFDWELLSRTSRNANVSKDVLTEAAKAFCETVSWYGYTPMIYLGLDVAYNRMDLGQLSGYDRWFAQYGVTKPSMYYDYRIWQYSDSGSVPGIDGKVDMDIIFIPY